MKISLITTVYNEADEIEIFLRALENQTKRPDEVIIADGGSTDGTVAKIREFAKRTKLPLTVLALEKANISEGRNAAITKATGDVIAATDASDVANDWLAKITAPFEDSKVDVVAGWYRVSYTNPFEEAYMLTVVPSVRQVSSETVSPSSRSIAFRKAAWERVGGYPENLKRWGEDTKFNDLLRASGAVFYFEPAAVVEWRPVLKTSALWRMYRNYGYGDGQSGHSAPYRKLVVLGLILVLLLALAWWLQSWWLVGLAVVGGLSYLLLPLYYYQRLVKIHLWPVLTFLRMVVVSGLLVGYVQGLLNRPEAPVKP
jgi:glycosyltransferase involved in cell wall biosynthesis